jgi:hypothetical protein
MELSEIENRLAMTFPPRHKQAMADSTDLVHEACDFLVPSSPYELLRLVEVNDFLHAMDNGNRWPAFLVAFASNGCGDYFAYDLRTEPPKIIYMDPDRTVDENLSNRERLEYSSFEDWYASKVGRRRTRD